MIDDSAILADETYCGELLVPSGDDGSKSVMPIAVHRGTDRGTERDPALAMIAGIYGSEYVLKY